MDYLADRDDRLMDDRGKTGITPDLKYVHFIKII